MAAFALAWVPALLSGQMRVYSDDDDDYSYSSREGLEFGVNIGVYRGFPQAAYFYDGAGDHELSDVGAQIWGIRERLQQLQGQQLTHPVTGILNEFPAWNIYSLPLMQYKPSMFFGLKAAKFWNPETALVCHVDVAQVTAEGSWSLSTGLLPDQGQGNEDVRTYPIIGKEQRLNIALGYRTSIYIAEGASWAFELGGLANAVAIEENYIVMSPNVGNALYEVNLLTAIGNGAGGQLSPASNVLTQWGTGFYSSLGLAVEFEEGGHVELNVRASRDNINLGTEAYKGWNVAAFLTWMIPSQLGDFVRASF
ncbi:MAG: hypothetical protein CBC05_05375 [Crocinitomicaceae bacterium TMED45]|jgi:hypothetical protein|nr:MAG: hypothetical protein CBC05_05375 [Crocinitomicaceae bacterium TMED45]|tara:strand:+ start:999 stop:1925 length:927 start_codon:yes stop_codon:yes gene_type:complete